jgi:hypothetical protein
MRASWRSERRKRLGSCGTVVSLSVWGLISRGERRRPLGQWLSGGSTGSRDAASTPASSNTRSSGAFRMARRVFGGPGSGQRSFRVTDDYLLSPRLPDADQEFGATSIQE